MGLFLGVICVVFILAWCFRRVRVRVDIPGLTIQNLLIAGHMTSYSNDFESISFQNNELYLRSKEEDTIHWLNGRELYKNHKYIGIVEGIDAVYHNNKFIAGYR